MRFNSLLFISSLIFSFNSNAGVCVFNDSELGHLNEQKFEIEYHVKLPVPQNIVEVLNRFFGNFSAEDCKNAFTVTKITDRSTNEYYLAFYTSQDICDGGNAYGVIVKGKDNNIEKPYALIEDSYIDCYVLK